MEHALHVCETRRTREEHPFAVDTMHPHFEYVLKLKVVGWGKDDGRNGALLEWKILPVSPWEETTMQKTAIYYIIYRSLLSDQERFLLGIP